MPELEPRHSDLQTENLQLVAEPLEIESVAQNGVESEVEVAAEEEPEKLSGS
jgi:hypothetical protein